MNNFTLILNTTYIGLDYIYQGNFIKMFTAVMKFREKSIADSLYSFYWDCMLETPIQNT